MYRCVKKKQGLKLARSGRGVKFTRESMFACLLKEFTPHDSHALTDCPIVLKVPLRPLRSQSEHGNFLRHRSAGLAKSFVPATRRPPLSLIPPLLSGTLHMVLYCSDLLPHAAGNEPNSPAFTLRAASLLLRFPRGLVGTLPQHSFTSSMIGGTSFLPPWPTALLHLLQSGFPLPIWRGVAGHGLLLCLTGRTDPPACCSRMPRPAGVLPLLVLVEGQDLHTQFVSSCCPPVELFGVL